jgi:hypothetical protein
VSRNDHSCRLCDHLEPVGRRDFLRAAAYAAGALAFPAAANAKPEPAKSSESVVKLLYDSLTDAQKKQICFAWDHADKGKGVLRSHISNNWRITKPAIKSTFFTADQQRMIRDIFEGLVNPEWVTKFDKQFKDDMGGFGLQQSIALFGTPGGGKFEFVLTGRHGTMRCDGDSADHLAFAGPIVYGHAASGYYEKHNHPNNVFWHQAKEANRVYEMLDGKQQKLALLPEAPDEAKIAFQGAKGKFEGIPVAELSKDQKEHVQKVLQLLIEPYRQSDRDEAVAALKKQGGLDRCHLAFYKMDDLGEDGVWDNWRLEGPAFVWHWRGAPHVHVWVHVADDPTVGLNAKNDSGPLRK